MTHDTMTSTKESDRKSLIRLQLLMLGVLVVATVGLKFWALNRLLMLSTICISAVLIVILSSVWLAFISKSSIQGLVMLIDGTYSDVADSQRYKPLESWSSFFSHHCYGRGSSRAPLVSNPEVQECLDKLIQRIREVYIDSWYSTLTKDTKFAHLIETRLYNIMSEVISIVSKQDIESFIFSRLIPLMTAHLVEFKVAEKNYEANLKSSGTSKLKARNLSSMSRFYSQSHLHSALKSSKAGSSAVTNSSATEPQELLHLRKLSEKLLLAFMPKSDSVCAPLLAILVEIFSSCVLKLIVDTVSDPHFFYSNMEIALDSLNKKDHNSFVYNTLSKYIRLERVSDPTYNVLVNKQNNQALLRFRTQSDERLISFVYLMDHVENSKNLFEIFFVHEEILIELKSVVHTILNALKKKQREDPECRTKAPTDVNTLMRFLSITHKKAVKKAYMFNNKTKQLLPSFLRYKTVRGCPRNRVVQAIMDTTSQDGTEFAELKPYVNFIKGVNSLRSLLNVIDDMYNSVYASRRCSHQLSGFSLSRYNSDIPTTSAYYHIISSIIYDFLVLRHDIYDIPLFLHTECLLLSYFDKPIDENLLNKMDSVIKTSKQLYDSFLSPSSELYGSINSSLQYSVSAIASKILPDANAPKSRESASGIRLITFILAFEKQVISRIGRSYPNLLSKGILRVKQRSEVQDRVPLSVDEYQTRLHWQPPSLVANNYNEANALAIDPPNQSPCLSEGQQLKSNNISVSGFLSIGRRRLSIKKHRQLSPMIKNIFSINCDQHNKVDNTLGDSEDVKIMHNAVDSQPVAEIFGNKHHIDQEGASHTSDFRQQYAADPSIFWPLNDNLDASYEQPCAHQDDTNAHYCAQGIDPTLAGHGTELGMVTPESDIVEISPYKYDTPLFTRKKDSSNLSRALSSALEGDECVVAISDNIKIVDSYLHAMEEEDMAICNYIKTLENNDETRKLYIDLLNEQSLLNAKLMKVKRARRYLLARELSESICPNRINICVNEINGSHPIKNYEKITYSAVVTCFSPNSSMFNWKLYFTYHSIQCMLKAVEYSLNDTKVALPPIRKSYLSVFKGNKNSPRKLVTQLTELFDYMCSNESVCKSNIFRRFICSHDAFSILQDLSNEDQDCSEIIDRISKFPDPKCVRGRISGKGPYNTLNRLDSPKLCNDGRPSRKVDSGYGATFSSDGCKPSLDTPTIGVCNDFGGSDYSPDQPQLVRPLSNNLHDDPPYSHINGEDMINDVDDFVDTPNIPIHTSTTAILNLLFEVFNLRNRRNWIRRQVLALILPQILGPFLKKKSSQFIKSIVTDSMIIRSINYITSLMDPEPLDPPMQVITIEQRTRTLLHVRKSLTQLMNKSFSPIIGEGNTRAASHLIWSMFQDKLLNGNIIYLMLDEIADLLLSGAARKSERSPTTDNGVEVDTLDTHDSESRSTKGFLSTNYN